MYAQSLGNAGAEAVGLDERAHERANVVDASAVDEIAQGFGTRLSGAHFEIDQVKFIAQVGMGVMQVFANAHQRLVQRQSGFDANYGEIKSVGQGDADALLAVFDHALQEKAGKEEAERGHADQQAQTAETGEKYNAAQAQKRQQQTGAEVVAGVARFAKSGLNQPAAGARDVGGRERNRLADGVESLLKALFHLHRRFLCDLHPLPAQSAEAGSQHGTRRHNGRAEGEHHQHDGDKHDDSEN